MIQRMMNFAHNEWSGGFHTKMNRENEISKNVMIVHCKTKPKNIYQLKRLSYLMTFGGN